MVSKELVAQAKAFKYDLNNARHEYSFAPTDEWIFSQNTEAEKSKLEAAFYPVLFTRCEPGLLASLTDLVTETQTPEGERKSTGSKDRVYLVAHCLTKKI